MGRSPRLRQYVSEPRTYELMTILSPEVPEDDIQGQLDSVSGYVTTAGGTVTDVSRDSPWGRRRLAYAIRHAGRDVRDGYYAVFHLDMPPTRVVEIERDIKLNPRIMRYLIILYEPKPADAEQAAPAAPQDAPAEAAPAVQIAPAPRPARAPRTPRPAPAAPAPAPEQPQVAATDASDVVTDSEPPAAPADIADSQTAAATETTPSEESETPPAQPDPTLEEE